MNDFNSDPLYIMHDAFYSASFSDATDLSFSRVKYIGSTAFAYTNLTSISAPECEVLGYGAFYSCNKLKELNLPEVYHTSSYIINFCTTLSILSLPKLEYADTQTFTNQYLYSMREVYLDNANAAPCTYFPNLNKLVAPKAS